MGVRVVWVAGCACKVHICVYGCVSGVAVVHACIWNDGVSYHAVIIGQASAVHMCDTLIMQELSQACPGQN